MTPTAGPTLRLSVIKRRGFAPLASTLAGLALAFAAPAALAQDADPNLPAVKAVCGRCHGEAQFMDKPRSWDRWNDVFRQMARLGASGSDQQYEQVTNYFLDHLTTLNVNKGSAEELSWVLGVSDGAAARIIVMRQGTPFASLAQLAAVPGVSRARLERLKSRIEF
jgi:DNA uptake protein ComE-like DNA-binding protein